MDVRKNTLWKVPVYCLFAGVISFYASLFLFSNVLYRVFSKDFVSVNNWTEYIVYFVVFFAVLMAGGKIFLREMSKKEIFISATIIVCIMEGINVLEYVFNISQPFGAMFSVYISMAFQWISIIFKWLYDITKNIYISAFISSLVPYLFVFFGKSEKGAINP